MQSAATRTTARNPDQDFNALEDAGNTNPTGLWSDGETIWVADGKDSKLYAYKMATRSRNPAKDFDTLSAAENNQSRALWSAGTTMWITDSQDDKIYT